MTPSQMAHAYADSVARNTPPLAGDDIKVWAGASLSIMRGRKMYSDAHQLASRAMCWCNERGVEYDSAASAVSAYRSAPSR